MSLASNVKAVVNQLVASSDALDLTITGLVTMVRKPSDELNADEVEALVTEIHQSIATIKAMSTDLKSVL